MPATPTPTSAPLAAVARVLLALLFLVVGLTHALEFETTAGAMARLGLPVPSILLTVAVVVELAGGASLLAGVGAHVAALALIGLLIPATLILHGAGLADPATMQQHLVDVLQNVAVAGGLLLVHVGADPGERGLEQVRPRKRDAAPRPSDREPAARRYAVIDSPYVSIR